VVYCAELFGDPDSLEAKLLKHVKRVMAGEYSRELSSKLSRAHRHQATLGFAQGGGTPYGFRRLIVDNEGNPRMLLKPGQRKAVATDRVTLVPGPLKEQETVRQIFRWYSQGGLSFNEIARRLRAGGPRTDTGRPWTQSGIRFIVGNEAYIGIYTYCKTSSYLRSPRKRRPSELWVRSPTLTPIISNRLFHAAQKRRVRRYWADMSDEELLQILRQLLLKEGYLSSRLIEKSKQCPSSIFYSKRFGSLQKAYSLIGYTSPLYPGIGGADHVWTDEELIDGLCRLKAEHGYVTGCLIDADPTLPSPHIFARHFGTIRKAYERAGMGLLTLGEIQSAAQARRKEREHFARRTTYLRPDGSKTIQILTEVILDSLGNLLKEHGYLSATLINSTPNVPSAQMITRRFGSLQHAYALVGWDRSIGELISDSRKRMWRRLGCKRIEQSV